MKTEEIARIAHEVNRAYCASLGDTSQPPWEGAPEWQRESAIKGVIAHAGTGLTPEQIHESWLREKVEKGWVWGELKDAEMKTHPCIVPYDELPLEQRTKDYLFGAVCAACRKVD